MAIHPSRFTLRSATAVIELECNIILIIAKRKKGCFSSNIDFFIKLLLKLGYELLLSEMQNKKIGGGGHRLRFGDTISEKSVFLMRYGSNVRMSKNIANESLEQNFLCQFYMSGSIKQIKTIGSIFLRKFNL